MLFETDTIFGNEGAEALLEALDGNTTLTWLSMGGNNST